MASKKIFSKDIAMFIVDKGLDEALKKYDLKPTRAREVVAAMIAAGVEVPARLQEIAEQVRDYGHRQPPPVAGEEREYVSTSNARVSVNVSVIGIGGKQPTRVKYGKDQIIVTKVATKRGK